MSMLWVTLRDTPLEPARAAWALTVTPRAGHVLIIPRRVAERNQDLTPEELTDLWYAAPTLRPSPVLVIPRHATPPVGDS